jgi:hypothetical protein
VLSTIGDRHEVVDTELTTEPERRRHRWWQRLRRAEEAAPDRDLK